jgi:menaquinone-specific isochorismate synthase
MKSWPRWVPSHIFFSGGITVFKACDAPDTTRICGLNAFNPEQGSLFLPRLLWLRNAGIATLRLHLWSATSLQDDARQALDFLQQLGETRPIPALALQALRETHQPDKPEWLRLVRLATQTIAHGDFEKVVLARATDVQFNQPVNAIALMAASRALNLHCYHFCMVFDASNAFLGSTPERLWRRRGVLLRTEALAGTVASHAEDKQAQRLGEWLMNDDKNQRENMLVVEDICQRLQHHTQTLEVLPAQIVRLRKVQHLRRCIWTALKHTDDEQCLHVLQPTAAVAGYRVRRRVSLSKITNRSTESGMPDLPGIYLPDKVSFVWRSALHGCTTTR